MAGPAASRISQRRSVALSEGGAEYASKRAELVRLAADVFREKGYAAASLNDIASRFGTDRASLYYYIGSKEELFRECVADSVRGYTADAEAIAAEPVSPREKLSRLIALVINSQVEHYPYMFVYVQQDMRQLASQDVLWASEMLAQTHRFEKPFLDAIAEGVADGSIRSDLPVTLIANSVFGMMQWTHRWWIPGQKYGADELIRAFSAVFFDGVATASS